MNISGGKNQVENDDPPSLQVHSYSTIVQEACLPSDSSRIREASALYKEIVAEEENYAEILNCELNSIESSFKFDEGCTGTFNYEEFLELFNTIRNSEDHVNNSYSFETDSDRRGSTSDFSKTTAAVGTAETSETNVNREVEYLISDGKLKMTFDNEEYHLKNDYFSKTFENKNKNLTLSDEYITANSVKCSETDVNKGSKLHVSDGKIGLTFQKEKGNMKNDDSLDILENKHKLTLNEECSFIVKSAQCVKNINHENLCKLDVNKGEKIYFKCGEQSKCFSETLQHSRNVLLIDGFKISWVLCKNVGAPRYLDKSELQRYCCEMCGSGFESEELLDYHVLGLTSENIHQCRVCKMFFVTNRLLQDHMYVHSYEEVYKCNLCEIVFKSEILLRQHMSNHSDISPCDYGKFDRNFQYNSEHIQYRLKHDGGKQVFKCEVCFKVFKSKVYLKQHMFIHNGIRPYLCSVCSKAFRQRNHLKLHIVVHYDERPFRCNICDKAFKRKDKLERHMLIHSGEE